MFGKWFGRNHVQEPDGDSTSRRVAEANPTSSSNPPADVMTSAPWSSSGMVLSDGGDQWTISCSSLPELRIAKREIRARQKELRVQKRELNAEMTQIRAHYRQKNANRGPSIRGGGGFGRALRTIDQVGRAADRRIREGDIAPYERAKLVIDKEINTLDRLVILLDQAMESLKETE